MPKDSTLTFILIAAALIALLAVAWFGRRLVPQKLPYFAKEYLLSKGEHAFYRVLLQALPQGFGISMKTRLSDVIGCTGAGWKQGFGAKISQKHVDFVIVDPVTTAILLVIELDDKTHRLTDRRDRDIFVDRALATAGVPILRVPAAAQYDPDDLRETLDQMLRHVVAA